MIFYNSVSGFEDESRKVYVAYLAFNIVFDMSPKTYS